MREQKRMTKRLFWPVVLIALALAGLGVFEVRYVIAPLMALAILRFGFATFGQFGVSRSYIPSGDPVPVDPRSERVTYWCEGCGAEVLLLVRGTPMAPRHCGEKMTERIEIPRDLN